MNDLRACESAEVASWGNSGAGLSTKWKVAKLRGGAEEEQLMWLCELKVHSGKSHCNNQWSFYSLPMVQALCRDRKWLLLLYTDNFEFGFLTFGLLLFSLPHFSVYFHLISLVVMQHRTSLINGVQRCVRLWNFAEGFWLVGLASGSWAAFLATI